MAKNGIGRPRIRSPKSTEVGLTPIQVSTKRQIERAKRREARGLPPRAHVIRDIEENVLNGIIDGKPAKEIARQVGLTEDDVAGQYGIIRRPHVVSALTGALDRAGATVEKVARVLADALDATIPIISSKEMVGVDSGLPDHKVRKDTAEFVSRIRGQAVSFNDPDPPPPGLHVSFHLHPEARESVVHEEKNHKVSGDVSKPIDVIFKKV